MILLYQVVPSGQKSGAANLELNKPIVDAEFLEFANKPIVGDGENKPIMGGTFTQNLNKPIMRTHCSIVLRRTRELCNIVLRRTRELWI